MPLWCKAGQQPLSIFRQKNLIHDRLLDGNTYCRQKMTLFAEQKKIFLDSANAPGHHLGPPLLKHKIKAQLFVIPVCLAILISI